MAGLSWRGSRKDEREALNDKRFGVKGSHLILHPAMVCWDMGSEVGYQA